MTGGGPIRLTALPDRGAAVAALERIFFESSSRTEFASEQDRLSFFERWTSYYLDHRPEYVWLWMESDGGFSGYLTGCLDSAAAGPLYESLASYTVFEDRFAEFPAHLHVNCRSARRNVGIGAGLVDTFINDCVAAGVAGVHVVTAPGARNVRFYNRVGFTERVTRAYLGRPLLFMGRRLGAESKA